jgi:large subunit ribosomal protein L13
MTEFIKKKEVKKNWYKIDATNLIVGRLASEITKILRGTKKTSFTPNMDDGDFVIVTNARKIKFTGKKFSNKIYYKHTGYPGGIKETTPNQILQKDPSRIIKLAVKRMLPRGPLGRKQLGNLKVYNDDKHPHETQKAVDFDFKSRNKKNSLN